MSYDLAIWKRSEMTKTAMLAEAYAAICEGNDHPALTRFKLGALETALKAEFGDYETDADGPFLAETGDTEVANWMILQCNHSQAAEVLEKVIPIALAQDLLVYDPQRGSVWGNKRPAKAKKK